MCTLRVFRFHPASWNKAGLPTPIDDSSWPSSIWHIGGDRDKGQFIASQESANSPTQLYFCFVHGAESFHPGLQESHRGVPGFWEDIALVRTAHARRNP